MRGIEMQTENAGLIRAGDKQQTRRVIIPQPIIDEHGYFWYRGRGDHKILGGDFAALNKLLIEINPYGQVGDFAYIKQVWATLKKYDKLQPSQIPLYDRPPALWHGDQRGAWSFNEHKGKWRNGRFMPRWAAGIFVKLTSISVEHVQQITAQDAIAEGISKTKFWTPSEVDNMPFEEKMWDDYYFWGAYPQIAYARLWDDINLSRGYGWNQNPFVYRVAFEKVPHVSWTPTVKGK